MSDLISRSALLKALEKEEKECEECMITPAFSSALVAVELQPSVEPVRGEWIKQDDTYTKFMCSNCGSFNHPLTYDFCPNCGADMRGEKND